MSYLKISIAAALAMVILMGFAGSASATRLTAADGQPYGGPYFALAEGKVSIHGTISVTCEVAAIEWEIESQGLAITAEGPVLEIVLEKCSSTVDVVKPGRLIVHTDNATADGNGKVTWTAAQITVETHNILGTVHCLYEPENVQTGTLTGSPANEGKRGTLKFESEILAGGTDFGCGSSSEWTGHYIFTEPAYLNVD